MGWNSCYVKSKTEVFQIWIKLGNVSDDRLLKTVHNWSKRNTRGWEARVLKLSNNLNVTNVINDQNICQCPLPLMMLSYAFVIRILRNGRNL